MINKKLRRISASLLTMVMIFSMTVSVIADTRTMQTTNVKMNVLVDNADIRKVEANDGQYISVAEYNKHTREMTVTTTPINGSISKEDNRITYSFAEPEVTTLKLNNTSVNTNNRIAYNEDYSTKVKSSYCGDYYAERYQIMSFYGNKWNFNYYWRVGCPKGRFENKKETSSNQDPLNEYLDTIDKLREKIGTGVKEGTGAVVGVVVALASIPGGQPAAAVVASVGAAGFVVLSGINIYEAYNLRIRLDELYEAIT